MRYIKLLVLLLAAFTSSCFASKTNRFIEECDKWNSMQQKYQRASLQERQKIALDEKYKESLTKVFSACKKAAKTGNTKSQSTLGLMYHWGEGTTKNPDIAKKWFEKAARKNDARAYYFLSMIYKFGLGDTRKNEEKFKKYLNLAAAYKYPRAFATIGKILISQNRIKEGLDMLKKGANLGSDRATSKLSSMYSTGDHVEQDFEKALYWIKQEEALGFDMKESLLYLEREKRIKANKLKKLEEERLLQEKKQADIVKARRLAVKEAKQERKRINDARLKKEKRTAAENAKKEKERLIWVKTVKLGDDTFCGPIIQVNGPMIKIAVRVLLPGYPSEIWLKRTELYPETVGCKNENGRLYPQL